MCTGSAWPQGPVAGFYEHANGPWGYTKGRNISAKRLLGSHTIDCLCIHKKKLFVKALSL